MNILLQNRQTLKYINPAAGWTDRHHEARIFSRGLDALLFCFNSRIANMVLLFEFPDSQSNFSFAVTDYRGA